MWEIKIPLFLLIPPYRISRFALLLLDLHASLMLSKLSHPSAVQLVGCPVFSCCAALVYSRIFLCLRKVKQTVSSAVIQIMTT